MILLISSLLVTTMATLSSAARSKEYALVPVVVPTSKLMGKTIPIAIGGIFPMSGSWAGGVSCYPAAVKALHDVNWSPKVLPNHYLVLYPNNSKCEPGLGTNALFDLIHHQPTKLMILGPGCSTVSAFVAEAAKMWNLVVLSYGSSSPALSNRHRFPTFFRTHPSATLDNPARIKMIKHEFNWTQIAIIHQIEEVFMTTAQNLEELARDNNITVVSRQTFLLDPLDAVRNLKKHDARIIVGLFYDDMARDVLCAAYKENMATPKHVWFLIGWYADNWWMKPKTVAGASTAMNCSEDEMRMAVDGHFTVEPLFFEAYAKETFSGTTPQQFDDFRRQELKISDEGYVESPLAYDAVWAMALAINTTITRLKQRGRDITRFNYNDVETMLELKASLAEAAFSGLSGKVSFSALGDRIAKILVEQFQNGTYRRVGYYDSESGNLTTTKSPNAKLEYPDLHRYYFVGQPEGHTPRDRKLIQNLYIYVSTPLLLVVAVLAVLHATACVAYGVASHRFAQHRSFVQSFNSLNLVVCAGAILANAGVCIFGLANTPLALTAQGLAAPILLHCGAALLSFGVSAGVGAMFLKMMLVWRIKLPATDQQPTSPTTTVSMSSLLPVEWLITAGLVTYDLAVQAIWPIVDGVVIHEKPLIAEERVSPSDDDIYILPHLYTFECRRSVLWLAVLLGEKIVLLLAAVLLAVETRNVKRPCISDAKLVSLALYNIGVFALIIVPLDLLIKDKPTAAFSFMAGAVLCCTWLTLGLIAVPKAFAIWFDMQHARDGKFGGQKSSAPGRRESNMGDSGGIPGSSWWRRRRKPSSTTGLADVASRMGAASKPTTELTTVRSGASPKPVQQSRKGAGDTSDEVGPATDDITDENASQKLEVPAETNEEMTRQRRLQENENIRKLILEKERHLATLRDQLLSRCQRQMTFTAGASTGVVGGASSAMDTGDLRLRQPASSAGGADSTSSIAESKF